MLAGKISFLQVNGQSKDKIIQNDNFVKICLSLVE
jgi:hypothetical protein